MNAMTKFFVASAVLLGAGWSGFVAAMEKKQGPMQQCYQVLGNAVGSIRGFENHFLVNFDKSYLVNVQRVPGAVPVEGEWRWDWWRSMLRRIRNPLVGALIGQSVNYAVNGAYAGDDMGTLVWSGVALGGFCLTSVLVNIDCETDLKFFSGMHTLSGYVRDHGTSLAELKKYLDGEQEKYAQLRLAELDGASSTNSRSRKRRRRRSRGKRRSSTGSEQEIIA